MNSIPILLFAATISNFESAKQSLETDPVFAGYVIHYCENEKPSSCKTIDRSKETKDKSGFSEAMEKVQDLSVSFRSLSLK